MRRVLLLSIALVAAVGCGTNYEDAGRPDHMVAPGFTEPDKAPGPEGLKSGAQQWTGQNEVKHGGEHAAEGGHGEATTPATADHAGGH